MTVDNVREDLREIKYYYSNKEVFDSYNDEIGQNVVKKLVEAYNKAVSLAPARLYVLYINLYIKDMTQEAVSIDMNVCTEYIQRENAKLLNYFKGYFDKENKRRAVDNYEKD